MSREQILQEMGLGPVWRLRASAGDVAEVETSAPKVDAAPPVAEIRLDMLDANLGKKVGPVADDVQQMDWPQLADTVAECRNCSLCKTRKQAVLGVGDVQADWLFVGEGPGAEEDERGEPFVGQAGKLLDNMLAAIDLKRGENVYIANAVKCRPPGNRTPEPEETAACGPYLQRQIALLQPKLIVALGRPAAQTLLQRDIKIGAARGQLHDYNGIPVLVTYHPAYLLRNPTDKALAWEDLCFARRTMA